MDKLLEKTFDLFSFIIPGILYLVTLLLLCHEMIDIESPFLHKEFSSYFIISIIFISYLFGYIGSLISKFFFQFYSFIHFKILRKEKRNLLKEYPYKSYMYQCAIKYSPANFEIINKWNSLVIFSHNIGFSILLLYCIIFFKIKWGGILLLITGIFIVVLIMRKAIEYKEWRDVDLINLYTLLVQNSEIRIHPIKKRYEETNHKNS